MMLEEKDRLTDSLVMQKYIADGYNTAAIEASNTQLKEAFINILRDEHLIQHEIFNEMSNRGWYQPKPANINDINQNLNKWNQELQRVQTNAYQRPVTPQGNYQTAFPQYGYQAGAGMAQTGSEAQQQTMYRPPQNPIV